MATQYLRGLSGPHTRGTAMETKLNSELVGYKEEYDATGTINGINISETLVKHTLTLVNPAQLMELNTDEVKQLKNLLEGCKL